MAGKNSANFKSSSPVKDAGLSSLKLGFKSRREHPAFSPASAGSKRDEQADSYKPKNAKSGFEKRNKFRRIGCF